MFISSPADHPSLPQQFFAVSIWYFLYSYECIVGQNQILMTFVVCPQSYLCSSNTRWITSGLLITKGTPFWANINNPKWVQGANTAKLLANRRGPSYSVSYKHSPLSAIFFNKQPYSNWKSKTFPCFKVIPQYCIICASLLGMIYFSCHLHLQMTMYMYTKKEISLKLSLIAK